MTTDVFPGDSVNVRSTWVRCPQALAPTQPGVVTYNWYIPRLETYGSNRIEMLAVDNCVVGKLLVRAYW